MNIVESMINSIRWSVNSKNWHAAIACALIMPDICGNTGDELKAVGDRKQRFQSWFDLYVGRLCSNPLPEYDCQLSGEAVYYLRCAFLHLGTDRVWQRPQFRADIGPDGQDVQFHQVRFIVPNTEMIFDQIYVVDKGIFYLDPRTFCLGIAHGCSTWLTNIASAPNYRVMLEEKAKLIDPSSMKGRAFAWSAGIRGARMSHMIVDSASLKHNPTEVSPSRIVST